MFSKTILAAFLAATANAANPARRHGVSYFWENGLLEAREDPIISPGMVQSQHVHTILGGNGFSVDMGDDSALDATCTGAMTKGDNSNYWFPKLYFKDPKTGKFEGVQLSQLKAYYFFEPTDDDIKPFPPGFRMVSGNPFARANYYKTPWADHTNYDGSAEIQPVSWSCGRNDNKMAYSYPAVANQAGNSQGPGFPNIKCDNIYSPLASYVHFPSCADLSVPYTDFHNNTAWPTIHYHSDGSQRQNCPAGMTHLPHLFMEIHWNAVPFNDRWTEGVDEQPFVLAQGDQTGYGGHADFISGWDVDVLTNLINNCDSGAHGDGLDSCPGIQNFDNAASRPANGCTMQPKVPEVVTGVLDKLPGCNPIQAGPGDASMCDCSGTTPVCNGKVVSGGGGSGSGSGSGSSSSSMTPTSTTSMAAGPTGGSGGSSGGGAGTATTTTAAPASTQTDDDSCDADLEGRDDEEWDEEEYYEDGEESSAPAMVKRDFNA